MEDWAPITEKEIASLIADAVAVMEPPARSLWSLIRIRPAKWRLSPWGDEGGGFWAVGILGQRVVWYNDIEEGFNISRYEHHGVISDYRCSQDELQDTMNAVLWQFETGEAGGHFGPPEPLNFDT
jgi:hypothetical protein